MHTCRDLEAAKQQADARIGRQERELHLLQQTVLELGTAMQSYESSEAAWGDSLASVQEEMTHMQQVLALLLLKKALYFR